MRRTTLRQFASSKRARICIWKLWQLPPHALTNDFFSCAVPGRLATHSEPDSCGSTSGFGGMNWELLIRSATMSGSTVAPLIWTPSFQ